MRVKKQLDEMRLPSVSNKSVHLDDIFQKNFYYRHTLGESILNHEVGDDTYLLDALKLILPLGAQGIRVGFSNLQAYIESDSLLGNLRELKKRRTILQGVLSKQAHSLTKGGLVDSGYLLEVHKECTRNAYVIGQIIMIDFNIINEYGCATKIEQKLVTTSGPHMLGSGFFLLSLCSTSETDLTDLYAVPRLLHNTGNIVERETLFGDGDLLVQIELICSNYKLGGTLMSIVEDHYKFVRGYTGVVLKSIEESYMYYLNHRKFKLHCPKLGLTFAPIEKPRELFEGDSYAHGYFMVKSLA